MAVKNLESEALKRPVVKKAERLILDLGTLAPDLEGTNMTVLGHLLWVNRFHRQQQPNYRRDRHQQLRRHRLVQLTIELCLPRL